MTTEKDALLTHAPLKERAKALATIASWESKIRILFQDYADTVEEREEGLEEGAESSVSEVQEEELQEQLEDIRADLLESLKSQFATVERDAPSKTYEAILYALLLDRLRRNFGYFAAISQIRVEAQAMNNMVGDQVFDVDAPKIAKLLSSIDEIYFVRQLCLGLGLPPYEIEQIVEYQIQREFKPRSK